MSEKYGLSSGYTEDMEIMVRVAYTEFIEIYCEIRTTRFEIMCIKPLAEDPGS
jgi:hypothetical protein